MFSLSYENQDGYLKAHSETIARASGVDHGVISGRGGSIEAAPQGGSTAESEERSTGTHGDYDGESSHGERD